MYRETMGGVKPAGEITADVVVGLTVRRRGKRQDAHTIYVRTANTLTL